MGNALKKEQEIEAYLDVGRAQIESGHVHQAIETYETALQLAEKLNKEKLKANAYFGLGDAHALNNQHQTAIGYNEKALEIAKEQGDKQQETRAYLGLGESYAWNNQYQTAVEYFEKALEIAKERKGKEQETGAYLGLGETYRLNNQLQTAIEYYEKALEIAKEREDKQKETWACLGLGESYRLNNQFQTAIEYHEKALEIAKERGDKQQETWACLGLGGSYKLNNQLQTAIEYYEKALEIAKGRGDKQQETRAYLGLRAVYGFKNQYQKAIEYNENALRIADKMGNKYQESTAKAAIEELSTTIADEDSNNLQTNDTSNVVQLQESQCETVDNVEQSICDERNISAEEFLLLGRSCQNKGQIEEAIKSYEQALQIADETDRNDTKAKAFQRLGNIFTATSEYKKAIEYYQRARDIYPGIEADEMEIIAYHWLGYNHLESGQYKVSIEYYNEVVKLGSQFGERKINAYLGLGSASSNTGDFESSQKYFLKALTLAEKLGVKNLQRQIHINLGHVYSKSCHFDTAVESYLKAQEISHDLDDRKEEVHACLALGNTFQQLKEIQKAIEWYQKALSIGQDFEDKEIQARALHGLGFSFFKNGQYEEALKYSKNLVELTADDPDYYGTKQALEQKRLGMCYAYLGRFQKSLPCFKKALEMVRGSSAEKALEGVINEWCGYCCRFITGQHQEAIQFYEKTKEIAKKIGLKGQEYRAYQAIGHIFGMIGDYEKSKEYYQEAMKIAEKLGDKYRIGTSLLGLASLCSKYFDYEMAIGWYEKAVDIFGTEIKDDLLQMKALTGLGVTWFNLGDIQKATQSIQKARELANKETHTESRDVDITQEQENGAEQQSSSRTPVPDSGIKGGNNSENVVHFEVGTVTAEWVNSVVEEAYNPSKAKSIPVEELDRLEKYINEFSASYVYTYHTSGKEPFTENVGKSMTRNVKELAYVQLLGWNNDKPGRNDEKFGIGDLEVFNFASDQVFKNASTIIPTRLLKSICKNMKSIGRISCGTVCGTCFLVTDNLVITNYHVYGMINEERIKVKKLDLPIVVSFDYLGEKSEHVLTVEVDETQILDLLEEPRLDYKFLCLKENEGLKDRNGLGSIVRSRPLQSGLVVIVGHPGGDEMHQETCVVISNDSLCEKVNQRAGMHMTNPDLLQSTEQYQGRLAYDSTLFSGASGSPVFDLDGNIVALHTQGYTLTDERGKCSLMQFGIQFSAICDNLKRWNMVEHFFPDYDLAEPMDEN